MQAHSSGGDSVDIDRARPSRVLEDEDNQSVCIEYRSSLARGTSPDTVICWRVLSGPLSAPPMALRVRNTGGRAFTPSATSVSGRFSTLD